MKRIIFLLTLLIASLQLRAQINFANALEIKTFLKSKTLVVLDEDPGAATFNEALKACVIKFWTLTPYEFINTEQFDAKKNNKAYSFIMLSEAEQTEKGVSCKYNFLNLILGGYSDINAMPDLGSVPLSYVDVDEASYLYKIGGLLLFMQSHVKYTNDHPGAKLTLTNKDSGTDIKTKELWLLKEELPANFNTIEKIKTVYPYTVKLVSKDDIKKAINDKNPNVVFLHKVGPEGTMSGGKCWKFLVTANNGEVLYYDGQTIDASDPDAFLEKDFKAISKK
jgi:hypothetical protein